MRAHARSSLLLSLVVACLAAPAAHAAPTGGAPFGPAAAPGGADEGTAPLPGSPRPVVPGRRARLLPDGRAAAPAAAPREVQRAIWRANDIQDKPYRYGGGHGRFRDSGYDCSGTVSFALNGGGLLARPLDSSGFMRWGVRGRGDWVTVYSNPGHAYAVMAGLRLDTSAAAGRRATLARRAAVPPSATEKGPRWRPTGRPSRGFAARHPAGL